MSLNPFLSVKLSKYHKRYFEKWVNFALSSVEYILILLIFICYDDLIKFLNMYNLHEKEWKKQIEKYPLWYNRLDLFPITGWQLGWDEKLMWIWEDISPELKIIECESPSKFKSVLFGSLVGGDDLPMNSTTASPTLLIETQLHPNSKALSTTTQPFGQWLRQQEQQ